MMRIYSTLVMLFLPMLIIGQSAGQISSNPNVSMARTTANDLVQTFDLREDVKVTRVYMFKNWEYGQIVKSDGALTEDDYALNYDLLNEILIVKIKGKKFAFPPHMMNGFVYTNLLKEREFVKIKMNGNNEIFELLVKGEYSLLRTDEVEVKNSNYVPALDVGSTGQSSVIKEKFFVKVNDRMKEIPKKKKEAEALFRKYRGFKKYSENNKTNFKKQEDLIKLFLYLNNSNN